MLLQLTAPHYGRLYKTINHIISLPDDKEYQLTAISQLSADISKKMLHNNKVAKVKKRIESKIEVVLKQ